MTTKQDSVDVERAIGFMRHNGLCAIIGGYGYCSCGRDEAEEKLRALSLPITQRDEQVDQARREAIMLLDEINKQAKSRAFYGIHQTLHAKLCTIRMTLARPDWQAPATAIRRLSIEQGDQNGDRA